MRVLTAFVVVLILASCIGIIYFVSDTKVDRCAEYCHPRQSGLMDTGTCACWGYKIEIIDMEDVP